MVHYPVHYWFTLECVVHEFSCVTTPISSTMMGLTCLVCLFRSTQCRNVHYFVTKGCDQILTTPLCNSLMSGHHICWQQYGLYMDMSSMELILQYQTYTGDSINRGVHYISVPEPHRLLMLSIPVMQIHPNTRGVSKVIMVWLWKQLNGVLQVLAGQEMSIIGGGGDSD